MFRSIRSGPDSAAIAAADLITSDVDENDKAFTDYIIGAIGVIISARIRRALAEQAQRYLPDLVAEGELAGAVLLANNAYMTLMSESATPLLVQSMVSGLSAYYDELPEE